MDIIIKSYYKDFVWLQYCLASIRKYCTGFNEIILIIDHFDRVYLRDIDLSGIRLETVKKPNIEGYLWQQWVKLYAAKEYATSDEVMYIDSDTIIIKDITPDNFKRDGKLKLYRSRYENVGSGIIWREITKRAIGFYSDYEYMRRMPLTYYRSSVVNASNYRTDLYQYISGLSNREFSEFNYIGQYIERNEVERYSIIDVEMEMPESISKQYWSLGGLTEEIKEEIENIIYYGNRKERD